MRSVRQEGQAVAAALEERAVPYRLAGAAALFQRAEVRTSIAWLRVLADPDDAAAVVRALTRPPVELRAGRPRARRPRSRGGASSTWSPRSRPRSSRRSSRPRRASGSSASSSSTARSPRSSTRAPDVFVRRLIERLGLRRQQLFAAQPDVAERLVALARLAELAAQEARRAPQADRRDFARLPLRRRRGRAARGRRPAGRRPRRRRPGDGAADRRKGLEFDHVFVLGLQSSRMPGARRVALEPIPDELLHEELPADTRDAHVAEMRRLLHLGMTRAREGLVLAYVARTERGAAAAALAVRRGRAGRARRRLGGPRGGAVRARRGPARHLPELRDEVLATCRARRDARRAAPRHRPRRQPGVARYLELLKLAALIQRPDGAAAAPRRWPRSTRCSRSRRPRSSARCSSPARSTSCLDAERDARARARRDGARDEPSLEAFLPRRGDGLVLSASDIDPYRTCPLKYKFARVFGIPQEPTINQRFGILVHNVLERYHQDPAAGRPSTSCSGCSSRLAARRLRRHRRRAPVPRPAATALRLY